MWLHTTTLILTDHAFSRYNERVAVKSKEDILEEARKSSRISSKIKNIMFKKDNQVAYRYNNKNAIFIIKPEKGCTGKFIIVTVLNINDLVARNTKEVKIYNPVINDQKGLMCIYCKNEDVLINPLFMNIYCYDCDKESGLRFNIKYSSLYKV